VNGSNTPRCHTYPSKVKGFIENQGTSICNGRGFYECIAKPFINGLLGGSKDSSAAPATSATPASAGGTVQQAAQPTPVSVPPAAAAPAAVTKSPAPAPDKQPSSPTRKAAPTKTPPRKARTTTSRKARASGAKSDIPPPPKPITIKVP
jgi:hypothetical protein